MGAGELNGEEVILPDLVLPAKGDHLAENGEIRDDVGQRVRVDILEIPV